MESSREMILNAFSSRRSVRSFKAGFTEEQSRLVTSILEEVNSLKSPFGNSDAIVGNRGPGLGWMRFVAGETGWLMLKVPKNHPSHDKALIDAAFRAQVAVMKFQQNGIGSVWMCGTYNRDIAEQSCPGYTVECGVAYGIEDSPRFFEKTLKFFGNSSTRKPLNEIAYSIDLRAPITEDTAGENLELLKALRSGPSAGNNQTWRFLFEGNKIHLYAVESKYPNQFDMGIALANMAFFFDKIGSSQFNIEENPPNSPIGGAYICTYLK